MEFTYMLAGWEGSVNDGFLYSDAVENGGLRIPQGKFYLADAGFGATTGLLVPFRGVRYHLREWAAGNDKPRSREELFNLRHASFRNVVERIFGVVKRRWRVAHETSAYDLVTSAKIISALVALHNFIRKHDQEDLPEPWDSDEEEENCEREEEVERGAAGQAGLVRDRIANAMWSDYEGILTRRRQARQAQAARRRTQRQHLASNHM